MKVRGPLANLAGDGMGLEINGLLRLDWAGVPPPPPRYQAVLWMQGDSCLMVTFSSGATRALACA